MGGTSLFAQGKVQVYVPLNLPPIIFFGVESINPGSDFSSWWDPSGSIKNQDLLLPDQTSLRGGIYFLFCFWTRLESFNGYFSIVVSLRSEADEGKQ